MKKPDRKEFTRKFGARAAAKYATAMRNYRKSQKQNSQPNPKAQSESKRIATAMKREVGTRKSQKITDAMKRDANKPKSARSSQDQQRKPTGNSNAKSESARIASNMRDDVRSRKSGTHGQFLKSNPQLKSQNTSRLTGRQKIALQVAAASGGGSSHKRGASGKPTNPKKGQTYVTRTGMTMVWTGKNWKQKTK